MLAGAKPVFAEIEGESYGLDSKDVEKKIVKKTKAIMPIHYGGLVCRDTQKIRDIANDNNILLIEDAAESLGSKINDKMAMAVLPASYKIDFEALMSVTGSDNIDLASEEEFKYMFPDCEIGAMPPFGNLYDLDVYVAKTLAEDEEISFNAGTHSELIRMTYKDFERLVKPKVLKFSLA